VAVRRLQPPNESPPMVFEVFWRVLKHRSNSVLARFHQDGAAPGGHNRASFWIECLVLAGLVGVFLWRGFIPAWKSLNTDFPDYYLAARLYRQGYPLEQIYDWTWTQRQKDHAGIPRKIVTFTLLTPFSLLPVSPFSQLPPLQAKHCWLVVNLALLALTGFLLDRMTRLGARRIAILAFLAMVPLRTNFLFGQEYVLLLFLFTFAAWSYLKDAPATSGAILAVAGALKIYPCLFLFFYARKRQWRGVIGLLAGSLALWLLSIYLFGFETIRTYFVEVLPWPLRGEGQDPYNIAWNSFTALLHRLFVSEPELNPHPLIHCPTAYALLQPICQASLIVPFLWLIGARRAELARERLVWGSYVAFLLILSTNPATYDFIALFLTAVLTLDYLATLGRRREMTLFIALYAFVCFPIYYWTPKSPAGWQTFMAFPRLWGMTALWICLLWVLSRSRTDGVVSRLKSRETAGFTLVFLALAGVGFALNLLRLRGQFNNYATRLKDGPVSLLATDPTVAGEKVLFTAMTADGYATEILEQGSLTRLAFGSDAFHPTTAPGLDVAWVELASRRSRVVRFSLDTVGPIPENVTVEAEDAEKPAVSPDGKWLAFIRQSKGQGRLWVKELRTDMPGGKLQAARQLSPPGLDVLDTAFDAADRIVLSARRGEGQPALFTATPYYGMILPEEPAPPRRFPAFSPNGKWLAFSQLEGSNWQLWIRDVTTHEEHRLTGSDCNSVAPAWYSDSKTLVYATDCARGYGLTALCRIRAVP